jgi:hypothetical protein
MLVQTPSAWQTTVAAPTNKLSARKRRQPATGETALDLIVMLDTCSAPLARI